jgi:hypothetical protein
MHIEGVVENDAKCEAEFAKMPNGQLIAQMSVLLGGISTLKRLQEVGINPTNVYDLLDGLERGRVIINRLARARGIPIEAT